jgi:hypothetical protein
MLCESGSVASQLEVIQTHSRVIQGVCCLDAFTFLRSEYNRYIHPSASLLVGLFVFVYVICLFIYVCTLLKHIETGCGSCPVAVLKCLEIGLDPALWRCGSV